MFDNINEVNLKESINNCQNFLNSIINFTNITGISQNDLDAKSRTKIINANNKLKANIDKLIKKLEDYKGIADLITRYKEAEKEVKLIENQIQGLSSFMQSTSADAAIKVATDISQKQAQLTTNKNNLNQLLNQMKEKI